MSEEQEALRGEAAPAELDVWLAKIGLPQYSVQVKEYGYDQMSVLLQATEKDVIEMTEDGEVKMKKPPLEGPALPQRRRHIPTCKGLVPGSVAVAVAPRLSFEDV